MTSFFDKLKKGMDAENMLNLQENLEQDLDQEQSPQKGAIEKPSVTLISTPVSDKKTSKKKIKKINPVKSDKVGAKQFNRINKIKKEKKSDKGRVEAREKKKWFEPEGELTVDVYQTDKEIVIQSAVAGIESENLDISTENDVITIKGIRERPLEKEKRNYFYQECYWGRFSRKIISPLEIDGSRAKALIEQGILTIRIPKIERKKKRKIVVKE
jgi:HSP20 family protein